MKRFVYFRKNEDDAYLNAVENFRGATQGSASGKVDVHFAAASATVTGNTFDKITLSVTDGQEKTVMQGIASIMANCKPGNTLVIADKFANKYFGSITDVDSISLTTASLSATNAVLTTPTITGYKTPVEDVTADDTLTAAESGKIFVFQDAAAVLTLPDSGAGDIIGTTFTFISNSAGSGQEVKCADTANEKFIGSVLIADTDDATTAGSYTAEAADNFSSIEFTGATEGELGSHFKVTCYDTDLWFIEGVVLQGGGSATPFATS